MMTSGDPEGQIFLTHRIRISDIFIPCKNIRIYHEYEGWIEKSVPRFTDWHREACKVLTNGDPERQIFLTHQIRISGIFISGKNIRTYPECEGGIEKSVPRITVWHHKACRVMTNGDPEGQFFLTHRIRISDIFISGKNIRIYHECLSGIEKSVPRITVWHHEACRVMTNSSHEGWIFYPILTQIMDSFSCTPLNTAFLYLNMR